MRRILLRFDDICSTMDWEQWEKAMSLMESIGVTALLGVIPDCQDEYLNINPARFDFWDYLKELQGKGFTIAMHGCQHVFDINAKSLVSNGLISEFAGHSYEVQLEKIRKGKETLESHGIYTDVFFAPAHSYDDKTLKALTACGFKYISDGKSRKPYFRDGIICIPCRSSGVPKIGKDGYYTAVMHANQWTREDKKRDWLEFKKLCEKYKKEIVPFDEFKQRPCGWSAWQRIDEQAYVHYRKKIVPYLIKIKHTLEKILRRL